MEKSLFYYMTEKEFEKEEDGDIENKNRQVNKPNLGVQRTEKD